MRPTTGRSATSAFLLCLGLVPLWGCAADTTGLLGGCEIDADCPNGSCVAGSCRSDECTSECCSDADCPGSQICRLNRCTEQNPNRPDAGMADPEPEISVSPAELNFGSAQVGSEVSETVTVRNVGDADLSVDEVDLVPVVREAGQPIDFSFDASALTEGAIAPGEMKTLVVTYQPTDAITDEANLLIVSNDPDQRLLQLPIESQIKGEPVAAVVGDVAAACEELRSGATEVTELESIDFGDVPVGATHVQSVYLINIGSENFPLTVSDARTRPREPEDIEVSFVPAPVTGQNLFLPVLSGIDCDAEALEESTGWIEVQVSYTAVEDSSVDAEVVFETSDTERSEIRLPVLGTGVRTALVVSPVPVDFGTVFVGFDAERQLTLHNAGTLALDITGFELAAVAGTDPDAPLPFFVVEDTQPAPPHTLLPGVDPHIVRINFVPTSQGDAEALVIVESTDTEQPRVEVALLGRGLDPPILALGQLVLDFDDTQLGTRREIALLVTNEGGSDLELTSLELEPSPNTLFEAELPALTTIPSLETVAITVSFMPATEGQQAATLRLGSNDPIFPRIDVPVTGTGIDPVLTVEPAVLDFGQLVKGVRHGPETLTLRNEGSGTLHLNAVSFDEASDPDFEVEGLDAAGHDLGAGESLEVSVFFTPAAGGRRGILQIAHDVIAQDEMTEVTVRGLGNGCPDGRADLDDNRDDCEYACPVFPTEPELCDGADNDCDGQVDEGFEVGRPCQGFGECGQGVTECLTALTTVCSTNPGGSEDASQPEICDGADNDCNGQDDDGFNVGAACDAPGDCGIGSIECAGEQATRCSTGAGGSRDESQDELCDGRDNDCDGVTDNSFGVGESCEGNGECGRGAIECAGLNATRCSTEAGGSRDQTERELCDGLDNDCDGEADNGFGVGVACDGEGVCGAGVIECAGERETRCSTDPEGSADQSAAEICDGLDNDCDGTPDEGFEVGSACEGEGACGAGVLECDGDEATRCSTDPGGSATQVSEEVCDGIDNDCDGETDEGFSIGDACDGVGECGAGTLECAGLNTTRCSTDVGGSADASQPDVCDGLDNDCDGDADEDFPLGQACEGEGACGAGVLECFGPDAVGCSTGPGGSVSQVNPELCDAIDNDCDGDTDEGFAIGSDCDGRGTCGAGVVECAGPQATRCSTEPGGSQDEAADEVCDLQDNDCDGVADNGFGVGDPCIGEGECGFGTVECASLTATRCSANPGASQDQSVPERCDGLDNDCDGEADEDFGLGVTCEGEGECGTGLVECADELTTRCSTDADGSGAQVVEEICDGLDNDCDGRADEDFPLGQACDGTGFCGNGVFECAGPEGVQCSTDPGASEDESQPETCDGIDNDCDGEADEDFGLFVACDGVGACGEGIVECESLTTTRCSTDAGGTGDQSQIERCDDVDNDCDGRVDEDYGVGNQCDGRGACGVGNVECANLSTTRCSTEPGGSEDDSAPDVCDGFDNDCDGFIDEDFDIGALCDGVGECGDGTVECATATTTRCSSDAFGSADQSVDEICDGLDNDCDGDADEDFDLGLLCDGRGACGIGLSECAGPNDLRCSTDPGGTRDESQVETCDGRDDDCDGATDEGFDIGAGCDPPGECGVGRLECAGPNRNRCSTGPGGSQSEVSPESCDGRDNDCDGNVDEGFGIGDACDGVGACGLGAFECAGPLTVRCSTDVGSSQDQSRLEICDGLDNDCDGQNDEDFNLGRACDGIGECGAGFTECASPNSTRCSTDDGGSSDQSVAEICDSRDNDCDGQVDEDFNIGLPCLGEGACGAGQWECLDTERVRCSTNPGGTDDRSGPEVCDAQDNDCDGSTDEGFSVGDACDGVGACGAGQVECATLSTTRCSSDIGGSDDQASAEICDSIDNDCDGTVDEGFGVGDACEGIGACGQGTLECAAGDRVRCSTDIGGSEEQSAPELCDAIDNDCDGDSDEGWNLGDLCDGVGECGAGVLECADGNNTRCSTDAGGSADDSNVEICDGLDNDCDGLTDEGFSIGQACDGVGECGAGIVECATTTTTRCSSDAGGSADESIGEICDGVDNDCDGQNDEGFAIGSVCDGVGACGAGTTECASPIATRCSTDAGGSADQSRVELCNGEDDDCDGDFDEGFNIGMGCDGEGECGLGVVECRNTIATRCSTERGGSEAEDSPEICDGLDNDCDGVNDDGWGLGALCDGIGNCGLGEVECASPTTTRCNTDVGGSADESGIEVCDGLDNDCDNQTDEGFGVGNACDGVGACGSGVRECASSTRTRCSTDAGGSASQVAPELCDSQDNDCDGTTDEGYSIGDPCAGQGACGNGTVECATDLSTRCSTDPGGSQSGASTELCDGVDNNCDGATDEGWNLGANCDGVGECGAGVRECAGPNATRCSSDAGGSASDSDPEICDGLDNDCDGLTDEGFNIGAACDGVGACDIGVLECAGANSTRCSTDIGGSASQVAPEACNGEDDDCDGQVDEGFSIGAACDGVGECGGGVRECATATTTRCSTDAGGSASQATAELCDGLDNDCDGQLDDGFSIGSSCDGVGACGNGAVECASTTTTRCSTDPGGSGDQSVGEVCDGQDNDCDGSVDEGLGLGTSCDGVGACGSGVRECNGAGGTRCSTDVGGSSDQSTAESCDNQDNDCDGSTDEGFGLGGGCTGVGQCGAGTVECNGSGGTRCSSMPGGSTDQSTGETCDGQDNDCDGSADEGFNLGAACDGVGECGFGLRECNGSGGTRCSTDAGGSADQSIPEICDSLDNNCNGSIDDGFSIGASCSGQGVCGAGRLECATFSSTRCSTEPGGSEDRSGPELCDNSDNDCDGSTDEGWNLGTICDGIGECGSGVIECASNNQTRCSTDRNGSQDESSAELCDGLDNDCDGIPDEGWGLGAGCSGVGQCNVGGSIECATGTSTRCSVSPGGSADQSSPELCDDVDNDCDGGTDEDYLIGSPCDGIGACGLGNLECASANSTRCSTDPDGSQDQAAPESCDGQDNDCDGSTDEDYGVGNPCDGLGECGSGQIECRNIIATRCSTEPGGSQDQSQPEVCDGRDNDCDGSNDDGTVTQLCGTAPNATLACQSGSCTITGCIGNNADMDDRYETGCECGFLNEDPVDNACPGVNMLDVNEGQTIDISGNIAPSGDADYFYVRGVDTNPGGPGDGFDLYIRFTSNPSSQFEIDFWSASNCTGNLGCDEGGNSQDRTSYRRRTDFFNNSTDTGESNCNVGSVDSVQDGSRTHNRCANDTRSVYFRVRRVDSRKTCDSYIVRISNGT